MLTSPDVNEAPSARALLFVIHNKMFSRRCMSSLARLCLGEMADASVYSGYGAEEQVPRFARGREDSQSTSLRAARRTEQRYVLLCLSPPLHIRTYVDPTARSREAIETILTVQTRSYGSRDVSWSGGGGDYYVHTVDRAGLAKMRAMEGGASGRSSRSRR